MQPWLAISRGSGQDCIPVTNNADAEDVTVCWVAPIKLVPNIACQMTPAISEDSKLMSELQRKSKYMLHVLLCLLLIHLTPSR